MELGGESVTNLDVAAGDMRRNVLLDPAVKISRIDADQPSTGTYVFVL